MKVINGLCNLKSNLDNSILTIGKFDGIHLGHQELISDVVKEARHLKGTSVLLTFDQHPQRLIDPEKKVKIITPLHQKIRMISKLGIDVFIILHFDRHLALFSPEDFIGKIISGRLGTKKMIVGPDFKFGRNRSGNISDLHRFGEKYDFMVEVIPFVKLGETRISSTQIRTLVWEKNMDAAYRMLGWNGVFT